MLNKRSLGINAIMLAALLLFSGCQATPDDAAVDYKGGGLEKAIQQKGNGPYQAAESWQDEVKGKGMTVVVDAEIVVPDAEKYPVVRIEDGAFTQGEADRIFAYLAQGNDLYAIRNEMSKQEINDQITYMKQMEKELEKPEIKAEMEQTGMKVDQLMATWDMLLKQLEQMRADAPDTVEDKPANMQFEETDSMGEEYEVMGARVDLGRRSHDQIMLMNVKASSFMPPSGTLTFGTTDMMFSNAYTDAVAMGQAREDDAPDISLTREQAEQMANEAVQGMGIEGMKLYSLNKGLTQNMNQKPQEGWAATFIREVEGVPVTQSGHAYAEKKPEDEKTTDGSGDSNGMDMEALTGMSFNIGWYNETLLVSMDDSGITSINWLGKVDILETENDNVALLPFDQVQDKILKQIPNATAAYSEADNDDEYIKDALIETQYVIGRVELGLGRAVVKDAPGEYRFIPMWDVFGGYRPVYDEEKLRKYLTEHEEEYKKKDPGFDVEKELQQLTSGWKIDPSSNASVITINAVDGTLVDKTKGY